MSDRRIVSLSIPTAAIAARGRTGLTGVGRTPGYVPRHQLPAVSILLGTRTGEGGDHPTGLVPPLNSGDHRDPQTQK